MAKLIITLLLATLLQIHASEQYSEIKHYAARNPATLLVGSNIMTVSYNYTHFWIDSEDKDVEPCRIPIDTEKVSFDERTVATSFSQKILVWGSRSNEGADQGKMRRTVYIVLLLDPKQCSLKFVSEHIDEISAGWNHFPPEILVHEDSYDLFLPSKQECSPCRYGINGTRMEMPKQFVQDGVPIHTPGFRQIGNTNTYYYVYNYVRGGSKVFKLDQNYQDLAPPKKFTDISFGDFTIKYDGKNVYFAYVNRSADLNTASLIVNDENLTFKQIIYLPGSYERYIERTITSFDSQGNWHILILYRHPMEGTVLIRVRRYTPDGTFINELDFGVIENVDWTYTDVEALFIEDHRDCVILSTAPDAIMTIRCIELL